MSRRLTATALALAAVALTLPARAQIAPEAETPPAAQAPQAPQGQVIIVLPPGYGAGYGPGYAPPPYPAAPAPLQPAAPYNPPQPYYPTRPYEQQQPPLAAREARPSAFTMKLWAGAAYRRVFDVSFLGADLGVFLGGERRGSVWSGGIGGFLGRTQHGLPTYQFRPGASWETILDRVRLGLGLDLSWVSVQRATSGDMMNAFGVGGQLFGTVDVVQSGRSALYLGARLSAEWLTTSGGGDGPLLWGPTVMAGWRY